MCASKHYRRSRIAHRPAVRSDPLVWLSLAVSLALPVAGCGGETDGGRGAGAGTTGGARAAGGFLSGGGAFTAGEGGQTSAAGASGDSGLGGNMAGAGGLPSTGGMSSGGTEATGGTPAGGTATGGAPIGGISAGGNATGGAATGGNPTGGAAIGGVSAGGSATGGNPTGGAAIGGVSAGGSATASGGKGTGGVVTGGTASGGTATGGGATGGTASVPVCSTVASLPTMGTACSTMGESQCDASGNQCVCSRGVWYCNTSCASTYPTEPTPNSACIGGAACNYPSGVSCQCLNSRWVCIGTSDCPAAANMPLTGDACNGSTGVLCDYPNSIPFFHMTCFCMANADASSVSTWTCVHPSLCPTTQPAYSLTNACPGTLTFCSYGSTPCSCLQSGTPWVCGLGILWLSFGNPTGE
jgi:hypothetical protein